jgi:hypothetical protein
VTYKIAPTQRKDTGQKNEGIFFEGRRRDVPGVKGDLVAFVTLVILKLKVVHGPAALALRQIGEEVVVISVRRRFRDGDLCLILVERENDVLGFLFEFQLLECLQAFLVHGYAR